MLLRGIYDVSYQTTHQVCSGSPFAHPFVMSTFGMTLRATHYDKCCESTEKYYTALTLGSLRSSRGDRYIS